MEVFNPVFKNQYNYANQKKFSQLKFDSISFGSTTRLGGPGKQNSTDVRDDLNLDKFTKKIIKNFKNKSKVNIYSLACSDGTEPYAVAIKLLKRIKPKQKEKFFPIHASDIDPFMINHCCESGLIGLLPEDIKKIGTKNLDRFLSPTDKALPCPPQWGMENIKNYAASDELKNAIEFKVGNMFNEIHTIRDEGNSVFICRNVLPHLKEHYFGIISSVAERFKEGSWFVIGDYDTKKIPDLKSTLEIMNFKEIQKNVFKKLK